MTRPSRPTYRPTNPLTCNNYPPLPVPYRPPIAPVGPAHQSPSRRPDLTPGRPPADWRPTQGKGTDMAPMYWCEKCDCAYPHGPEGPSAALQEHATKHHPHTPATGPPNITGRHVALGLLTLAALAWISRHLGHS